MTSPPADDENFEASLDGFPFVHDPENLPARDDLEVLLSQFMDEVRRGYRPSVEVYARRHPRIAHEIRELFPLASTLEQWKVDQESDFERRNVPSQFPFEQLGPYRLIEEVGRGGMAVVFKALDTQTQQLVAIKLHPTPFIRDRPEWRDRFQREAATIAQLRHQHIVRVFAFGSHLGYGYYVMELVAGANLDHLIRRLRQTRHSVSIEALRQAKNPASSAVMDIVAPAPASPPDSGAKGAPIAAASDPPASSAHYRWDSWTDFAELGVHVGQALAYAHQSGVIHNDVKPSNILLETTGRAVLTDFGTERHLADEAIRNPDRPLGTLRYMAPERLMGKGDRRSDLYSLGLTLYELCTLSIPFLAANSADLMGLILNSRPSRPRDVQRQIPRRLETIILNAIEPDPARRYPSAEALVVDLQRFLAGQSVRSLRGHWWNRLGAWWKKS